MNFFNYLPEDRNFESVRIVINFETRELCLIGTYAKPMVGPFIQAFTLTGKWIPTIDENEFNRWFIVQLKLLDYGYTIE